MPKKMNFIKVNKYGSAENMAIINSDLPSINDYEVLIKVFAIGINRPDILQRKGL